jgi:hypothetical protein
MDALIFFRFYAFSFILVIVIIFIDNDLFLLDFRISPAGATMAGQRPAI